MNVVMDVVMLFSNNENLEVFHSRVDWSTLACLQFCIEDWAWDSTMALQVGMLQASPSFIKKRL